METAPLTLAYTHARNAAQEQRRSNPVAASEEHDLAAAEFAIATSTTTDAEALRVLRLLETHHRQLGQILKDGHTKSSQHVASEKSAGAEDSNAGKEGATYANAQPPRLARTGRSTGRDLSTSIASNLASARGIPSTRQKRTVPVSPLISNEHADGTFAQDTPEQRRGLSTGNTEQSSSSRPSWAPPVAAKVSTATTTSDSPFTQFYNKFESAISTLTVPLAFASLPLSQPAALRSDAKDMRPPPQPASQSPRKVSVKADVSTTSLDYSQLISKAALRAVQDSNDTYHGRAPHESFLLVPTSGGTMSYADITAANYIDRQIHRQHRREISNASNDDFVDASSQILPGQSFSSLHVSQQFGKSGDRRPSQAQAQYQGKTLEEIHLENQILRRTLNETAKRVQAYESIAQKQTEALAQSIRSFSLSPVATPENSRGKPTNPAGAAGSELRVAMQQKRIDDLEEIMRKNDKRLGRREEENAKLKETLGKYREKWEGLKAGAKARREQAGGGDRLRRGSSAATVAAMALSPVKDTGQIDTDDGRKDDLT